MALSTAQLRNALTRTFIPHQLPVLVVGKPGVGKTDIISQSASDCNQRLIITHPVISDPTDYKGFPFPSEDKKTAVFLPFGDLAEIIGAVLPTTVLIDDLGQAGDAVQKPLMQVIHGRRIGEHRIPDCVTFVAATNSRADRAGVSGILEPVKSRFASIIEFEPSVNDWIEWATANNMPPELIAFHRFRGHDLLNKFDPTQDLRNSPSSRTWANLGKIYNTNPSRDLRMPLFTGAVGEGAAGEFCAFLSTWEDTPDTDALVQNPNSAPIPTEPSILWALTTKLAAEARLSTIGAICTYFSRLHDAGHGDFAQLGIKFMQTRNPAVLQSKEFAALVSSNSRFGSHQFKIAAM